MLSNTIKRNFLRFLYCLMLVSLLSVPTFAAESGTHTPVTGVTVEVSNATDNSLANGAITVTAKGSAGGLFGIGASAKKTTITVTNASDAMATISFDWTASNVNQLTIDGTKYTGVSGSFSKLLKAGDKFTVTIMTAKDAIVNTLGMKNFAIVEAKASSEVTFDYNSSLGSITVAGDAVADDTVVDVELTGTEIVATTNGSTFLGWVNGSDGTILSTAATYTLEPADDMTVRAAFAKSGVNLWFLVNNAKMFDDLNAADEAAGSGGIIVPMHDGTLPAGNYTISSGVTLLIPYNSDNTLCTTEPTTVTSGTSFINLAAEAYSKPTVYRTLNMASGANITVNGAMSLSGKSSATQTNNGSPYGPLSFVNMASGSNITVNNGGNLYVWGYITGSGTVTVKNGGTVYEDFQVRDWRGGTAASGMLNQAEKVFPVSQYYVQNVEVPMTLEAGALEYCYMSLVASKMFGETTVPFIGGSGMFQNGGTIVKDYKEGTDRFEVTVDGNLTMSSLNLKVSSYNMNSKNYVLPITNNLTVTVNSGTTTISQDMCMLPGSEIIVADGATVKLASNVNFFVYDLAEWENKLFVYSKCDVSPLKYVGAKKGAPVSRTLKDAKIVVNGTVDASLGNVYTTSGGANITSDGGGEAIVGTPGSATFTYQYVQSGDGFTKVPITPAKLLNSDNSYEETARAAETLTYTYIDGFWRYADAAVWYDGAGNEIKRYLTLGQAISDYEPGKGYIQMLSDTTESTIGDVNKDIYLDLNGQDVTVTELKLKNLYGMDTATNGFTSNAAGQYGEIIGTVSGTVAPNYRYDRTTGVSGKYYVVSTTDNKLSFHRFDMGVTDYTFYGSGNTGEMVFNMVFKGDALAKAEILKRGVEFNSSYDWSSESADTLTGGISEIKAGDFTTAYTVKAAVMLRDADDKKVSDNPVFTGDKHFADRISFQSAMKFVYDGLTDEAKKADFAKFADANGFSLSN